MATFEAKFRSECVLCGGQIEEGDVVRWKLVGFTDSVVHHVCPEERVSGEVCEKCFMEKSLSGECGCDG